MRQQKSEELRVTHGPAHLALVDGDGPGQLEGQLQATQVDPATTFEHQALGLQHLGDSAQEAHSGVSWVGTQRKEFAHRKHKTIGQDKR